MKSKRLYVMKLCLILFGVCGVFACQKVVLRDIDLNNPLAIARTLDKAGDTYRARRILEKSRRAGVSTEILKETTAYINGLDNRKTKAPGCIKDAKFNIKTSRYRNRINRHYFQMGYCYEVLGDLKLALENYNRSIELRPKLAVVFIRRGLLHERNGNLKAAREDFEYSVRVQKDYPPAHFMFGMFLARRGEIQLALKEAGLLKDTRPDYALLIRKSVNEEKGEDYAK